MADFGIKSREHYELMEHFERTIGRHLRVDRETKEMWHCGSVYQNGEANNLFIAYREGYSLHKCITILGGKNDN